MLAAVITGLLGLLTTVYGNVVVYTRDIPHSIMEEFRDLPASFGPDLPADGLRGFLVAGEPSDGCSPLVKPPADTVDNFTTKWIVLIARYNCSFEIKVRNAQAAGYDCAIVHNVNASDLEVMSAKNPDGIDIPSVFVSDLAGLILSQEYLYSSGFYIMVNGDLPFNINTHLLLPFAIVVVLCLLVILIFMIVKCIKDRRRARRHRLPHRALAKIPTCKFSKGDPYDTCAICLDDYQDGDKLRVLPCAHAYHAACIDPWLTQNKRVCPVCKRRVLSAGERRRAHSDSDSDTEPLLHADAHNTQGGTFEEQRENPFNRAARFMARLRARSQPHTAEAPPAESAEHDQANENNEENGNSADTQPLISGVSAVSERRARRNRRSRARNVTAPPATPAAPAAPPHLDTPAPAPPAPAAALAPHHTSINATETPDPHNGHIGVAALPASDAVSPDHVDL